MNDRNVAICSRAIEYRDALIERTTYELIARGELEHVRLGRRIVVPKRVIADLIGASHHE